MRYAECGTRNPEAERNGHATPSFVEYSSVHIGLKRSKKLPLVKETSLRAFLARFFDVYVPPTTSTMYCGRLVPMRSRESGTSIVSRVFFADGGQRMDVRDSTVEVMNMDRAGCSRVPCETCVSPTTRTMYPDRLVPTASRESGI